MKKITIKFLTILTLSMSLGSCADFLDVQPKSSSPDYLMFSTSDGFVHAMNGVYMVMRGTVYNPFTYYYGGYTRNATGFFEYLGGGIVQSGSATSIDVNLYIHNYSFSQIESGIVSYYTGQYKTIANLNLILQWIDDEYQDFLTNEMYSMIKGEALALRSYLLFELIQTFGPPPTNVGSGAYIPYPKDLSTAAYNRETYASFMGLLSDDILEAERLLEQYDPIIESSVSDLQSNYTWRGQRQNKMNYYALMGLKARVQLYTGDKPGALESALVVINATNSDGTEKFPFMAYSSYSATTDMIGVCEHMFAFEHNHVGTGWYLTIADCPNYFKTYTSATTGSFPNYVTTYTVAPHGQHLLDRFPDAVFANAEGIRAQDLRYEKWFSRSGANLICQKFYPLSQIGHKSALPILRKAEMYLIAAECAPTLEKASEYLSILRENRLAEQVDVKIVYKDDGNGNQIIDEDNSVILKSPRSVTITSEEDRMNWIIGEYSREFIMEGRAFFAWKRLGLDKIPYPTSYYDTDNAYNGDVLMNYYAYTLPIPTGDIYILD